MQSSSNKLTELVEQAASAINLMSATDLSEIENLQKILDDIKENIAEMSGGPSQLLEEAQVKTSQATQALQEILQKENQDIIESIEIISQAILALQKMTDDISSGTTTFESEQIDTDRLRPPGIAQGTRLPEFGRRPPQLPPPGAACHQWYKFARRNTADIAAA